MEEKKYEVYYIDNVNEPALMFSADSQSECEKWIYEELEGKTPVDDEHPCTEDVFNSSKVFSYEIYQGGLTVEIDGEEELNNPRYTSDYYYAD